MVAALFEAILDLAAIEIGDAIESGGHALFCDPLCYLGISWKARVQ